MNKLALLAVSNALALLFIYSPSPAVDLTFLYWSDFHAQNLPTADSLEGQLIEIGGFGNLAGIINDIKLHNPRVIVVNAGDEFTGSPVSTLTRGESQIRLLNLISLDAFLPGPHEFDYGWKSLLEVTSGARFPIALANVVVREAGTTLFPPYKILQIDSVRVGMAGIISEVFKESVIRSGVVGLDVLPAVESVRKFTEAVRDSCDLLVAITHQGWKADSLLASAVDDLDIIIGGENPTPINPPRLVNGVIIVQSGPFGRYLGRLEVEVDTARDAIIRHRGELIPVQGSLSDPLNKADKLARKLNKKYTHRLNRQIGTLQVEWKVFPDAPSNLPQWTAYALHYIAPNVNLAVVNNENCFTGLKRGPIRELDLWNIFPYENSVIVFQITGEELIRAIHRQINRDGDFLTWSGLQAKARARKLEKLLVNGTPVQPYDEYSIITNGFVWDHLDRLFGIRQEDRPMFAIPGSERDFMIEAVKRQGVIALESGDWWDVR